MFLNKILPFFFDAPTDGGGGNLSITDMVDELGKDELPLEPEKESELEDDLLKEPKKEKEDKKEKEEDDLELEDEEEPEIDELEPVDDVPRKDILKKYPTLFKEFPQLEKAYYREKAYAEILPTLEDAREAVDKSKNYDKFESSLLSGDLDTVLSSVKGADDKAFNKMVDNFLPMLGKVDQNAYFHVIGGVIKNTIAAMIREGRSTSNDDLQGAGVILNQFIFGKSEFEAPKSFGPNKEAPEKDEVNNERAQFVQERLESSIESLTEVTSNVIKSTINKHIDPKNAMTDYVRKTAVAAALAEVDELIGKDSRFTAVKDKLWEKAIKDKFSKKSLDDLKKAYLNRAKVLLPQVITKHKNEAMRGSGKRVATEREEPTRKGPVSVGRSAGADNTSKDKAVPKGMKTLDFLMQD